MRFKHDSQTRSKFGLTFALNLKSKEYTSQFRSVYITKSQNLIKASNSASVNQLEKGLFEIDEFLANYFVCTNENVGLFHDKQFSLTYFDKGILSSLQRHLTSDTIVQSQIYKAIKHNSEINPFCKDQNTFGRFSSYSQGIFNFGRHLSICYPPAEVSANFSNSPLETVVRFILSKVFHDEKQVVPDRKALLPSSIEASKLDVLKRIMFYLNGIDEESAASEGISLIRGNIQKSSSNPFIYSEEFSLIERNRSSALSNLKGSFINVHSDSTPCSKNSIRNSVSNKVNTKEIGSELLELLNHQFSEIVEVSAQKSLLYNTNGADINFNKIDQPRLINDEASRLHSKLKFKPRAFSLGQEKLSQDLERMKTLHEIDSVSLTDSNNKDQSQNINYWDQILADDAFNKQSNLQLNLNDIWTSSTKQRRRSVLNKYHNELFTKPNFSVDNGRVSEESELKEYSVASS